MYFLEFFFFALFVTVAAMYRAGQESRSHYLTRCEPNFIIWVLFFHFTKAKIIKFGGGTKVRLPVLPCSSPAWYIGVVRCCPLLDVFKLF